MSIDNELLADYAFERLESAFSDLVRRHIVLVYFAALRETAGNETLAEDVTRTVFLEMGRKATAIYGHAALASWLYNRVRRRAACVHRKMARKTSVRHT
jgi:DNA-directed RNA polymerase specialized sigma24 family protein